MRVVKFCKRNVSRGLSRRAFEQLRTCHHQEVDVRITDCFRRCLECRVKPFCRIQLVTIEAQDEDALVHKVLQMIRGSIDTRLSGHVPLEEIRQDADD